MLVIGRKPGEVLVIGGDIEIEILEATGSHVKLGIRAPKSVPVVRKEIQVVGEQNRAAARAFPSSAASQILRRLAASLDRRSDSLRAGR